MGSILEFNNLIRMSSLAALDDSLMPREVIMMIPSYQYRSQPVRMYLIGYKSYVNLVAHICQLYDAFRMSGGSNVFSGNLVGPAGLISNIYVSTAHLSEGNVNSKNSLSQRNYSFKLASDFHRVKRSVHHTKGNQLF